jgi:hypothetical protein
MASEGMVHALLLVHALLKPGGVLVNLHVAAEPPEIWLHAGESEERIGYLLEKDQYIEYAQSEDALARVQVQGWFELEKRSRFMFKTYAASYDELQDFLTSVWSDAELLPQVKMRSTATAARLGPVRKAHLREIVNIMRLARCDTPG